MHSHQHRPSRHTVMVGRSAAVYDVVSRWILPGVYRAAAADAAAALSVGGAVLDVGSGPGRLLVELSRRRPDLRSAGVDPSPDMVARSRVLISDAGFGSRAEIRIGTAEDLPYPDASFDLVVSTLSAHHWADPARAVAEQARVLVPGGRLRIHDLRSRLGKDLADALTAAQLIPETGEGRFGPVTGVLIQTLAAVKAPHER